MDFENRFVSSPYKITCTNYPSEFNLDKTIAKDYFRQFGNLKRVIFKPKISICTVEYSTKEGFLKALNNAGEYKGSIFEISVDNAAAKKKRTPKPTKPIWFDDNEVEAELKAMSGVGGNSDLSALKSVPSSHLLKPEKSKKIWNVEGSLKKKTKMKGDTKMFVKKTALSEEHLSLINTVLSQSHTTEDKFKVLDARDKLLRLKIKQDVTTKSGTTLGTCPDMCPEKERVMREIQHQISIYEQDGGKTMDHKKAIKQYSRSSADQETPLPHELRPVPILQMTMSYLMHNILDLIDTPDVNVSEWYHFLWDRTRGLRKDITQQELCCQGAVKLVEQCARFHIHCSARLVGEEPSVFDQKINTENLTKCLQTLKYMYHDLQFKNEYCINEPEFRAYVILLNMNDGNFMWEVQQLREKIQKSNEVKFALEVYSAFDKNNYVKFFKLVNSTTYLNACILMRYFVQVRTTALKYLLKCYAPRATKILYPLIELRKMLSFDDIESTIDFVQFFGLPLNDEKTHVILDKSTFVIPDIPYVLERSYNVIESKRVHSVGRVVCGDDLPDKSFNNHIPQNSFDTKGYLVSKDFLEEDDLEQASKQISDKLAKAPDEIDSINEDISLRDDSRSLLYDMTGPTKSMFGQSPIIFGTNKKISDIFQQPVVGSRSIFGNAVQGLSGSSPLRKTETQSFEKQINIEYKPEKSIFTTQQTFNFSNSAPNVFGSPIQKIDTKVPKVSESHKGGFPFNLIQTEKPKDSKLPITSNINQNILNPFQDTSYIFEDISKTDNMELLEKSCKTEGEEDVNSGVTVGIDSITTQNNNIEIERTSKSENIEHIIFVTTEDKTIETKGNQQEKEEEELQLLKQMEVLIEKERETDVKYILNSLVNKVDNKLRFEKVVLFKTRLKEKKIFKVIKKWRKFVLNKRKRKVMDCTPVWVNTNTSTQIANEMHAPSENITLSLRKRYKYGKPLEIDVHEQEEIMKINLFGLTYSTMKNRYFNLTGTIHKAIYWKVIISIPDEHELPNGAQRIENSVDKAFQWKHEKNVIEQIKLSSMESVTYCIEKQNGLEIKGADANGIIFIAKKFNTVLQRRIFEHLKEFGVFTKVPIVIILQEYDENECKLKALQDAKILSDYIILIDHLSPHALMNSVEEGLVFLASKIEISPPLELDTLYSFLKKYLCSEIWRKANSFAKWNSQYKICLRDPKVVIGIYNEALGKLTKIILDRSSKEYANFPQDFKDYLASDIPDYLPCSYQYFPVFWKSEFYIYNLEKLLKKLTLPQWQEKWPPTTEFELEVNMAKYCTKSFKNSELAFYKIMGIVLRDINPNVNFEDIENILWTNVIELFALEKLNELNLGLNGTDFENKSIYNQYIVVYNRDIVEKYSKSDWFYINNPLISRRIKQLLQTEKKAILEKTVPEKTSCSINLEDLNKTIEEATNTLCKDPNYSKLQKEIHDLNVLINDLETSIHIHKKINSKMGEFLRQSITDN